MKKVLILDFGSQYTQLIARRIREQKVYCEIHPCSIPLSRLKSLDPAALILSGGPSSVYDKEAPQADRGILELGVPILGICYGMQWLCQEKGGKVEAGSVREYGPGRIQISQSSELFAGLGNELAVWMSHGDHVVRPPSGFETYARSDSGLIAAVGDSQKGIMGLQFHPEVVHTPQGRKMLQNFLFRVAAFKPDWTMGSFVEAQSAQIRQQVGPERVILAVSGGVDSSVMAVLLQRALGDRLDSFFVNNGLLRKNEASTVPERLKRAGVSIKVIEASDRFLEALRGVTDPEEKRKVIGRKFISLFEEEARRFGATFLAQGTLYPDVIESTSFRGPSATIKSHHNVGGLPERMGLKLLEPFRELFKDEVREIGRLLGVPDEIILRQPFPGPGLAVRILGEVTRERLEILREADDIVVGEFKQAGLYQKVWQSFAVLLPVKTVGVMGDARTYEHVVALRVVESLDGMTADWVKVPYELLANISSRIINEVHGVNRVVYDISSKPPATIEWE